MARIERFEDIEAWQEARVMVRDAYRITGNGAFSRDFGLRDQLRRAAVSVMSCIAEGFEHGSDREFRRFLFIAKASAGEVRSLLHVALDVGYLGSGQYDELMEKIVNVSCRIARFISYLDRGLKQAK